MKQEQGNGFPDEDFLLRAVVESGDFLVFVKDLQGRHVFVNNAVCRTLGIARSDILGRTFTDLYPGDLAEKIQQDDRAVLDSGEPVMVEERVKSAICGERMRTAECGERAGITGEKPADAPVEEETRVFLMKKSPLRDRQGQIVGILGIGHDVTEKERSRSLLLLGERNYRNLYNDTPAMIHSIDREGRLLNVSDHWLAVMGYEREEVLGRRPTDFLTPESRKKAIEKHLPEFFKTGTAWNVPYRMVKKSGEEFDVLLSAVSVTDRNGEFLHSLAVISDVSELSRAERVLQEQEKRFRFLFEAAPLAYQTMDLHQTIRDVNQEWLDSMGYERDEVLGKPFSTFLSPQSRETLTRCFPRLLRSGSERNVELRMVRKDGSELSTLHHGRVVQGDNGSQTLTHCIFVDISERKQAEQARHDSEERLRALLSAIPDMMFLQDAHGRYIDAHAPGLNAYIKDPPDLLGKGMDEVIPLQLAAEVKQQLDGVFREGQPQEKVYAVDLEGKTRHLECRMVPCGEHVLSIVRDVTDRVELEEELRGHEVELARKNHELIEKNIALKELLYQFRQEKERTRTSVADNVEHLLLPLIYRMRSSCRGEESGLAPLLDIFESTVRNMIASPAPAFLNRIEKLTRREAEICNLIRNGLSSKEAARVLGVSTRSIETHRHNIRKKLGITGTRVDLGAYLARL